ncbi:AGE family epimerase/isomerase [Rhizosaccharibacter radicis]|uniref:AGE family epimerase/isomerase n=1 Tax=Rhizosaccharibacter radicis TaxID=2782605 RepID=A0ABT1W1F6_9PROT|nr:AGE family epimerase/isomerase [Acetobacteraceae bacterium KSS12]
MNSPDAGPLGRVPTRLGRVQDGFRDWMLSLAAPFWCRQALARPPRLRGAPRGAQEHLDIAGRPARPGFRRLRVQARLLSAFSLLAERGVPDTLPVAADIARFISRAQQPEGSWACLLSPEGRVIDPTSDLHDTACALQAFARFSRLGDGASGLALAHATLDHIERDMVHPDGGFRDLYPARHDWRHQTPHMHLLEAMLALHDLHPEPRWDRLASVLARLGADRFLDPFDDTLGERFLPDLHRAPGLEGEGVIPGHHAHWIWLLDRHAADSGEDHDDAIRRLDRFCLRHGVGPETALIRDEVGRDGTLRRGSARLWAQADLLHAQCALHGRAVRRGDLDDALDREALIERIADAMLSRFLLGRGAMISPPGAWIDVLDEGARPAADRIPAATLCHLVLAWNALEQLRPLDNDAASR